MTHLIWFRSDLRVQDNTALNAALREDQSVIACYFLTPKTWKSHRVSAVKIQFILNQLKCLSQNLLALGIPLLIREAPYFSDCPTLLAELCQQYHIKTLYINSEYAHDEKKRDRLVSDRLLKLNISTRVFHDQTVAIPGTILSKQGTPFKIFTPFKKTWLKQVFDSQSWHPTSIDRHPLVNTFQPDPIPNSIMGFETTLSVDTLWPAGEKAGLKRLDVFCHEKILRYADHRNIPGMDGTSKLSPYLAVGALSVRQCIAAVIEHLPIASFGELLDFEGPSTWISELIWREFYIHLLAQFPVISQDRPFRSATESIQWLNNEQWFQAWCDGITGYPIIDAAMRQLNQTGWMHNRLRMLVANFLTKSLFIDWRWGEHYFSQHLIDLDFSANNGNWQWSASTGTDAAPYFRIFNPTRQSRHYDPEGVFIRQFCPELSDFDDQEIHEPYRSDPVKTQRLKYPKPIIPLNLNRDRVLSAFKSLQHTSIQNT